MTPNPDQRGSITARELLNTPALCIKLDPDRPGRCHFTTVAANWRAIYYLRSLAIERMEYNDDRPATAGEMGGTVIEWREE